MRVIVVGAFLICTSGALARIGETKEQIKMRYGAPVGNRHDAGVDAEVYHFRGFEILVAFDNGVSAMEDYQKLDHSPMRVQELAGLLDANKGSFKQWRMPLQQGVEFYYREKDRFATYNAITNRFVVCVPNAINRMSHRGDAVDAQKMKSF